MSTIDTTTLGTIVGTACKEVRRGRKLTQVDVAARIGISAEFYARIERGHALPALATFASMTLALDVSADQLLGRSDGTLMTAYKEPADPPRVRRALHLVRQATPSALNLVIQLLSHLDEMARRKRMSRGHDETARLADAPANDGRSDDQE